MIPPGDSFFSTIAGSAAALLGLSFFALIFFLTELFRRYEDEDLALPIHPDVLRSRLQILDKAHRELPEHITDLALFDGDSLVSFTAFSVGVSWNMYFVSLVVSLTALSGTFANVWVFAVELLALWCFLTFSLIVRNKKRTELATYRTRDEHFWAIFEWVFVGFWLVGIVCVFIAASAMTFGTYFVGFKLLAFWSSFGIDDTTIVVYVLKIISLGGLFFCLYTTNKDFFIYFKSKTSDHARRQWLLSFIEDRYPQLETRIAVAIASRHKPAATELKELWNDGCPPARFVRDGLSPLFGKPDARWQCLLARERGVASWMFDVPGLALWESTLEQFLVLNETPPARNVPNRSRHMKSDIKMLSGGRSARKFKAERNEKTS